jgi:hypothetical protein
LQPQYQQKQNNITTIPMADITKCTGDECPLKETCYRYTAKESRYQSFFANVPYDNAKKECEEYLKIKHDSNTRI